MNLKIARSNLQLAEMNSEMLEEALRRGGEGFAGRMQPLPVHGSGKTSIDTTRTEHSQPATPNLASGPGRMSTDSTKVAGARSTSMTIPIQAGAPPVKPPVIRRRSGSEGGPSVGSSTAQTNKPGTGTPIPPSNRPNMERSSTLGPGQVAASTSAGSGFGSFFRKNIDKHGPGIMKDLGLQNLKMPDLQNLPIPSPSAATRAEFFSTLGISNVGATSSSPNLAGGFTSGSPTTSQLGGAPRSPLVRPSRGGWYDAAADMGGSSDAELQKLRASLVVTNKSVVSLKDELGAMKKAKAELEAELETLSQALFEEANKMVADERKKRAEKEAEAKEAIEEREALRQVVKLMEEEKARLLKGGATPERDRVDEGDITEKEGPIPGGFPAGDLTAKGEDLAFHFLGSRLPLSPVDPPAASQPKLSQEEDLAALMKRMEQDFGPLPQS
jgi:hypothetical protein